MIITDLDFSLLNNKRLISEYTKNVCRRCKECGIIIVFATTRPYRNTRIFYNSVKPDAIICHCGGSVYVDDKIIWQNDVNSNTSYKAFKNIVKDYPKIGIGVESEDGIFANFDISKYWDKIQYKYFDLENFPSKIVYKLIVELKHLDSIEKLKKYLPDDLYFEILEGNIGLILNKNATKWNGIKKLLEYYAIKEENTISFGDNDVDLEMIEKCGIGVAMENGNERIKAKAMYICKNNNEDGIAKWIEENIFEK